MTYNELVEKAQNDEPNEAGNRFAKTCAANGDIIACVLTTVGNHQSYNNWGRMEFWIVPAGCDKRKRYSKAKALKELG